MIKDCNKYGPEKNQYLCTNAEIALLLFESRDSNEIIYPATINSSNPNFSQELDGFAAHNWDGFYENSERLARFPALVIANNKKPVYEINYKTSPPPDNQNFTLITSKKNKAKQGLIIKLQFDKKKPAAYAIKVNNKIVKANPFDDKLEAFAPIKGSKCGENRHIGSTNTFEFYLDNNNCSVSLVRLPAVLSTMKLQTKWEIFFSNGGSTRFRDRMAKSMDIAKDQIKVISVSRGSVLVSYQLTLPEGKTQGNINDLKKNHEAQIDKLKKAQDEKIMTNSMEMGAPILEFKSEIVKQSKKDEKQDQKPEQEENNLIVRNGTVIQKGEHESMVLASTEYNYYTKAGQTYQSPYLILIPVLVVLVIIFTGCFIQGYLKREQIAKQK